jgi:hypothetical protein
LSIGILDFFQYELSFANLIKVKEIEIELKLPNDDLINETLNTDNQLDSSLSEDSGNEEHSNIQKYEPHPPSTPISDASRRHRHHQLNGQTQVFQSSISTDPPIPPSQNRNQQQKHSDNELDSTQIDSYKSNLPFRRKNIFQSLKLKKEKIPLPRRASAGIDERIDEKQNRKNRRMTSGSLRPARVNILILNFIQGGKET